MAHVAFLGIAVSAYFGFIDGNPGMKNRPFPLRLRDAATSLATAWRGESSFRTQTTLAAAAVLVAAATAAVIGLLTVASSLKLI